jgi:hypothetical protein
LCPNRADFAIFSWRARSTCVRVSRLAMVEDLLVIWAASRAPSPGEERILSQVRMTRGAKTRTISMLSLGRDILPSLARGAVIVVVSSRKDAATALGLGADETVRVAQSVTLRKTTLESAIQRALARSWARMSPASDSAIVDESTGLALLMRAVERRLGYPMNEASLRCNELADELTRVIGIVDRLMQRVQVGTPREQQKEWMNDIKDYARATLKAEALTTELRDQVQHGDAVVRLLGDLSCGTPTLEADAALVLEQLAELLREELADRATLEVVASEPCVVRVARLALISIICGAIENALANVRSGGSPGHLVLRASRADGEVVIEITDDGPPGETDLRAGVLDPLLANSRSTRLRQVREHVRRAGGDVLVDDYDGGNVMSIYLPTEPEKAADDRVLEPSKARLERRNN